MRWGTALLVLCCAWLGAYARAQTSEDEVTYETLAGPESPGPTEGVEQWSVRAEYLYWYLRRLEVPPLLTAGPAGSSAALGEPGTTVLRGGDGLHSRHDRYIGVRARSDWWANSSGTVGLQVDCFFLERDSTHFTARPGTVPVLAVPYVDAQTLGQRSYVVSGRDPERGDLIGGTRVYSRMELFGQEANVLWNLDRGPWGELNLIGGGRFLQLRERLDLTSASWSKPDRSAVYGLEDHFQTFDKFYGAQVGLEGRLQWGLWFLEGKAAGALGATDELIRNKGVRIEHTPQGRRSQPHGLFVLPSNRGTVGQWDFDAVGECRLNAGIDLFGRVRLLAGYTLLLWGGPVRPGDQVQPVDLSQVGPAARPGTHQPLPQFTEELFWAHGANVGVEVRW